LVAQGSREEAEEVLPQVDLASLVEFLVVGADVVRILPEQAEAERQRLLEEVRLLEVEDGLVRELARSRA
jgi:hypothetical protein